MSFRKVKKNCVGSGNSSTSIKGKRISRVKVPCIPSIKRRKKEEVKED